MTQASNLVLLAQAIGADIGALITNQGALDALTTADKSSLVNALNEVKAGLATAGASINDASASTSTVYSSAKTEAVAVAAAAGIIDDSSKSDAKTWSSVKLESQINAAIAAIVDGAPEAFNTLKEIADYIADDQSATAALTTAVNNRVKFNDAQSLTTQQKIQACENIGVGDPTTDFVAAYTAAKA